MLLMLRTKSGIGKSGIPGKSGIGIPTRNS
jgi:hypothetical protein